MEEVRMESLYLQELTSIKLKLEISYQVKSSYNIIRGNYLVLFILLPLSFAFQAL